MSRPPATTFDFLEYLAIVDPERVALVNPGESFSYGQFHADAMRFSSALAEQGVSRGQIVLVSHAHIYVHWLLLLACENIGAISVSYPTRAAIESSRVLARADHIFAGEDPPAGVGVRRAIFTRVDQGWLQAVFRKSRAEVDGHPRLILGMDEPQRITHSSGTTGGQKAMLLHRGAQEAKLMYYAQSADYANDERFLLTMPFSVNSAYLRATLCLRCGARVVVGPLVWAIRAQAITYLEVLPGRLEKFIGELPGDFVKPPRLTVKVIGAPLGTQLRERSLRLLCTRISCRYATNEVWPIAIDMDEGGTGTVIAGVEAKIVDEHGEEPALGQAGHIAVRSATMIDGYFDDPAATQRHFRGGWFLTGDLGRLPHPRRLMVLGRNDEVLNRGGLKCFPAAIEAGLKMIDGVVDAGVTSISSGQAIDDLCVALVQETGADARAVLEAVRVATAGWQRVVVKTVGELPRTGNGKLSRTVLRRMFTDEA